MTKVILILGATGKQGGAVLRALLAHPAFSPKEYTIYAATRDPASASAQRLAALSHSVKPVVGDLRSPAETFAKLPTKPWAVFAVTFPGKTETADGIEVVDMAVAAGASHVVFSSVDRGQNSPPSEVPHFIAKHHIEVHLRAVTASRKDTFSYTIIRPSFFLDNIEPGFLGKVFGTLWRNKVSGPLTVVDSSDVGSYGAAALLEPQAPTYRNAEFNIAGDKLTFEGANEIFKQKTGRDIPTTFGFVPSLLIFLSEDVRKMVDFFNNPGFAASPEESNKLHHMADFAEWVYRSKHVSKND